MEQRSAGGQVVGPQDEQLVKHWQFSGGLYVLSCHGPGVHIGVASIRMLHACDTERIKTVTIFYIDVAYRLSLLWLIWSRRGACECIQLIAETCHCA